MESQKKLHPAVAALIVIVLIGASTVAVAALGNKNNDTSTSPQVSTTTSPNDTSSTNANSNSASTLKDGEYTADSSYTTPGGMESIGVTVTLKNGIIENAILEQHATGGETAEYQEKFASGYQQLVVGKKISDVKLTRVAGSSLTSSGFNDALDQIQQDAAS